MNNKRRVFVSVYEYASTSTSSTSSFEEERQRLRHAIYRWAIMVVPKDTKGRRCHMYELVPKAPLSSSASSAPPQIDQPPDHNAAFTFRATKHVDLRTDPRLLRMVLIGKLPGGVLYSELEDLLAALPTPQHDKVPERNNVSWTVAAILALQGAGYADEFDVNDLMAFALKAADEKRQFPDSVGMLLNYTTRPL
ncbi:MAG: hypothetical protein M1838_001343 [Thelocarpon superellum]|nr:MAG: hypothetical protein M1838_001343 [Thelocarpon superellum]